MKRKKYPSEYLDEIEEQLANEFANHVAADYMADGELYFDLFYELLDMLVLERPQTQRVFLLKMQGLSEARIGKKMGISQQAVNKKIQRISHIKKLLRDVGRKSGLRSEYFEYYKPPPVERYDPSLHDDD